MTRSDFLRRLCCLAALAAPSGALLGQQPPARPLAPVGLDGNRMPLPDLRIVLRGLPGQPVEDTDRAPTHTTAQLRAGQEQWRAAVRSIDGRYTYRLETVRVMPGDLQAGDKGGGILDASYVMRFALKGEKCYVDFKDTSPTLLKVSGGRPHVSHHVQAYNGTTSRTLSPDLMSGQVLPGRYDNYFSFPLMYLGALPIYYGPNAERSRSTPQYVPTALKSPNYHLLDRLEAVDGFPCHVVSSGSDTLWLDPEAGFGVRRRVMLRRMGKEDPGCLYRVHACGDLRQVHPGVWLPFAYRRYDFGTLSDPPEFHGRLLAVHHITVESLAVNTVPDELFELPFPPSTDVRDLVQNKAYFTPAAGSDIDRSLADAREILADGTIVPRSAPLRSGWRLWALLTIIGVSVGTAFLVARSRWGARRGYEPAPPAGATS